MIVTMPYINNNGTLLTAFLKNQKLHQPRFPRTVKTTVRRPPAPYGGHTFVPEPYAVSANKIHRTPADTLVAL